MHQTIRLFTEDGVIKARDNETETIVQLDIDDAVVATLRARGDPDEMPREAVRCSDCHPPDGDGGTVFTGAVRGTTTQFGPTAQVDKSLPRFPSTWEKQPEPLIETAKTVGNQAGFPSVLHAEAIFDDPDDAWYLYWSGHDGGGIRLHTAVELLGPWHEHPDSPILRSADVGGGNHVASPCALYQHDGSEMYLYYHRSADGVQETEMVTSADGIEINSQSRKTILACPLDGSWDEQERSYLRIIRAGDMWVGTYQGRDEPNNATGIGWAWSHDGIQWQTMTKPLFRNEEIPVHNPQSFAHGAPGLTEFGGSIWILETVEGDGRAIEAVRLDTVDQIGRMARQPVFGPTASWEGPRLEAPEPVYHDGNLFMFYNDQHRNNERAIGVASTELAGY